MPTQCNRPVIGRFDIQNTYNSINEIDTTYFPGEKQADENIAVIQSIKQNERWKLIVDDEKPRSQFSPLQLQQLTLIDGFEKCVQKANEEFEQQNDSWRDRLWSIIIELPEELLETNDDKFISLGSRQGSSSIYITPYIKIQLDNELWLPSSLGPSNSQNCFSRFNNSRLISKGRANIEIGDRSLLDIVADNFNE